MTRKETVQTKQLADLIVEKFRVLVALENKILEEREGINQASTVQDNTEPSDPKEGPVAERQAMLTELESQLKESIEELEKIINQLKLEMPDFRTYVLPQISEIVGTLRAGDAAEQEELLQLVAALVDADSPESLERLEAIIITRLRDNLEKRFGI